MRALAKIQLVERHAATAPDRRRAAGAAMSIEVGRGMDPVDIILLPDWQRLSRLGRGAAAPPSEAVRKLAETARECAAPNPSVPRLRVSRALSMRKALMALRKVPQPRPLPRQALSWPRSGRVEGCTAPIQPLCDLIKASFRRRRRHDRHRPRPPPRHRRSRRASRPAGHSPVGRVGDRLSGRLLNSRAIGKPSGVHRSGSELPT
jgi:hypothetical protein